MFSHWVTSSYSPPDDVMSSNYNDVASGPAAEEGRKRGEIGNKKRKEGMGEEWSGVGGIYRNFLCRLFLMHSNLVFWSCSAHSFKSMSALLRSGKLYQAVQWPPSSSALKVWVIS